MNSGNESQTGKEKSLCSNTDMQHVLVKLFWAFVLTETGH